MKWPYRCSSRRIDLHVEALLVDSRVLSSGAATGEKSETIRERVVHARQTQAESFRKSADPAHSSKSPARW
jgi:predicted ATPase with chaperone activity